MFTRTLQVRFSECDGLGHVNNGTYFNYMEDARIDVFRLFNPALDLESWNLIVASTRCDFLAQVKYAEVLTVHTWVSKIGNSSFLVNHAIKNDMGTWVARGQATMIAYDYSVMKSMRLSDEVRSSLESHQDGPQDAPELHV